MSSDVARREEIDLLVEEIAELDEQVAAGDLDVETAEMLAARYRRDIEALQAADDADVDDAGASAGDAGPSRGRRVSGRVLAGFLIAGVAIVAIAVLAVVSLDRGGVSGAEGVAGDIVGGTGVDLDQISNEQMEAVVAENPDVVGMRLALARRYFEAGQFDRALDHYFEVLERDQHPEALANVGWMTYLSNRPDIALGYLEAALQRQADYLPAHWFISNVYVTLGRPDEAVPYLTGLIRTEGLPDEIVDNARTLLAQIEETS